MADSEYGGFHVIQKSANDPYLDKVSEAYADSPADWAKVLGGLLHFQWGVYSDPASPRPVSLDEAGSRHLDRQLQLAGLTGSGRPRMDRVLDLGCGWGATLHHLARAFPECRRVEGVNISRRQVEYATAYLDRQGVGERTSLYLCDAGDIQELPDPARPYDLVVLRGAVTHFPHRLYETCAAALAERVRPGGLLLISETLYSEEFVASEPPLPYEDDHLAIGYRKTPRYFTEVLRQSGFEVRDMRELPSRSEAALWLLELRSNLDAHFPEGAPPPMEAIRDVSSALSVAILEGRVTVYSVIAARQEDGASSG